MIEKFADLWTFFNFSNNGCTTTTSTFPRTLLTYRKTDFLSPFEIYITSYTGTHWIFITGTTCDESICSSFRNCHDLIPESSDRKEIVFLDPIVTVMILKWLFPIVIWTGFRIGQYEEDALHLRSQCDHHTTRSDSRKNYLGIAKAKVHVVQYYCMLWNQKYQSWTAARINSFYPFLKTVVIILLGLLAEINCQVHKSK